MTKPSKLNTKESYGVIMGGHQARYVQNGKMYDVNMIEIIQAQPKKEQPTKD